jgi:hypothetical protein
MQILEAMVRTEGLVINPALDTSELIAAQVELLALLTMGSMQIVVKTLTGKTSN